MKKLIMFICIVLGLFGVCYFILGNSDKITAIGSTSYYIKTDSNYKKEGHGKDSYYTYKTKGYNKNGDSKEFEFNTSHVLKTNRYLKLPIKDNKVLSYEEVTAKDLPDKVKEKLNVK